MTYQITPSQAKELLDKLQAVLDENTTPLSYRLENMKNDIEGELRKLKEEL